MKRPTLTPKRGEKAILWFQARFLLQDWTFTLCIQDDPPQWCDKVEDITLAISTYDLAYKRVKIWVSLARNKGEYDPWDTLFHEVAHIAFADASLSHGEEDDQRAHCVIGHIGMVCAEAYLK